MARPEDLTASRVSSIPTQWSRIETIFSPLALAFTLLASSLFQILLFSSHGLTETTALRMGAFYAPRALQGEWWRILTATAVEPRLWLLSWNTFATFVLGVALCSWTNSFSFLFVFFFSGAIATIAGVALQPQIVAFSSAPHVFGLIGALAALTLDERIARPRLPLLVGIVALSHLVLYWVLSSLPIAGFNVASISASSAAGFLAISMLGFAPSRKSIRTVSALFIAVAFLSLYPRILPHAENRFSDRHASQALRAESLRVVSELESLHVDGRIHDAEFATRLKASALVPAQKMLLKLRALPRTDENRDWLTAEASDWEFRCLGLQIVSDVYASKAELRRAQKLLKTDGESELAVLDAFWEKQLPLLNTNKERLLRFLHKPSSRAHADLVATAKRLLQGLDTDLSVLSQNAAELEIRSTESWLEKLKAEVIAREKRNPASQAPPGLSLEVDSRLERLDAIQSSLSLSIPRLEALTRHLERIQDAIPQAAALSDTDR